MPRTQTQTISPADLADDVMSFTNDPLGWVYYAYPWGEAGTPLANESGPDRNQQAFLKDLGREVRKRRFNGVDPVMPVLMAISSGHGTGKTVLGAWIAGWILSTRPYSIGTVTANTWLQLESRTWAAIQTWMRMCITAGWFDIHVKGIYSRMSPENWKCVIQTCKPENAQAFAGQHARTSTSWYLFDESSHIPDAIWDVAMGGLTDGEAMHFCWGQPARKSGRFYEICVGKLRDRWNVRSIDSRTARFTNKELIAEWINDHGEDSDFCRVRVRGVAPRAGELQYIDSERVWQAQQRAAVSFPDDPLIAGFDVAGRASMFSVSGPRGDGGTRRDTSGSGAWNVIAFRRGLDARTIPPIRIPGEATTDRSVMLAKLTELLNDRRPSHRIAMMFVDSAFGSPYVERLRAMGFTNVQEVNFGSPSPDRHQANMRAFMWNRMKDWLQKGAIPSDPLLEQDLVAPGFHLNRSEQLVLESKQDMTKRGIASPDNADALALTFATHVPPVAQEPTGDRFGLGMAGGSWMS